MRPRHWAAMGEGTFVAGIWALFLLHGLLGRRAFRLMLWPVVACYWLARPGLRSDSLGYLRRLQGRAGWRDGLAHVHRFADTMLDKMLAMAGRYPAAQVQERGTEPVLQQAATGRGAVLVTAHMGCLELCQQLSLRHPGVVVNVLVHTRHAQAFNRILRRLNPQADVRLVEVTDLDMPLVLRLADKVAAGEFLAIAGDRVPVHGGRTVRVEFLGAPADFPVGPYLLASLLDCPLYLMLCLHEGPGYALEFELLAQTVHLPRRDREQALTALATRYAQALTHRLHRSPHDWFNFYPFWAAGQPDDHGSDPHPL